MRRRGRRQGAGPCQREMQWAKGWVNCSIAMEWTFTMLGMPTSTKLRGQCCQTSKTTTSKITPIRRAQSTSLKVRRVYRQQLRELQDRARDTRDYSKISEEAGTISKLIDDIGKPLGMRGNTLTYADYVGYHSCNGAPPSAASPLQPLPAPPPVSRCASSAAGAVLATVRYSCSTTAAGRRMSCCGRRAAGTRFAHRDGTKDAILAKTKSHGNST
eukprot:SAG25_NODE_1098_length_4006_cov_14.152035_3_plen_215_part_00